MSAAAVEPMSTTTLGLYLGVTERACFESGYRTGWLDGRDAERSAWSKLIGAYRSSLSSPVPARLVELRRPTDEACPQKCRRCSRCVRYAAVWANQRRYGSADYPGVTAVAA